MYLAIAYFFYMMITIMVNIFFNTILLSVCPPEKLGRVSSCIEAIAYTSMPIGQLLFGKLFDSYSASFVMFMSAVFIALSTLIIAKQMMKSYHVK